MSESKSKFSIEKNTLTLMFRYKDKVYKQSMEYTDKNLMLPREQFFIRMANELLLWQNDLIGMINLTKA